MPELFQSLLQPLQITNLKLAINEEAYSLHLAALEWDLQEPIVIEKEEDIKSHQDWRGSLTPYHHQVRNLISFCRRLPVTLLADDVGLGKTISAGLIMSELISREKVNKVLIICPKLLMPQWQEELKTKFGIESEFHSGQELKRVLADFKNKNKTALITTYHSGRDYFDFLEKAGFEMLILDEAHKLRNLFGSPRPPKVATRIRRALAERTFKYVLMLTATPIQNRLWDLYSLVDLMSVAKGHKNPFGDKNAFANNFIADNSTDARHLKQNKISEFRSIVYSYMSRVRRGDSMLIFPERKVKLHRALPSEKELQLIQIVAQGIQNLNALSQISILQALVSSPQALSTQLIKMAQRDVGLKEFSKLVIAITETIGLTSKLHSLETLITQIRNENQNEWRMVIFTGRLETQKAIGEHLGKLGVQFGFINGASANKNQETIKMFWGRPPEINVIVSTEAGSEGVNLQVANVIMNYDLPWNPMIVEQRIGRIQRLGSNFKNVIIYNAVLQGTFEEKIVSRLIEKLQLASHAIGDIESLLEAAGFDEEGERSNFEDMIRKLVLASLQGKDVERDLKLKEESIINAKIQLESEESNINSLLGSMDDPLKSGPRAPKLTKQQKTMDLEKFVINALSFMGSRIKREGPGVFIRQDQNGIEKIIFDPKDQENIFQNAVLYKPGKPNFDRLVGQFLTDSECLIDGLDIEIKNDFKNDLDDWLKTFNGAQENSKLVKVINKFKGKAFYRVKVSVAHDSYEKLLEQNCESKEASYKPIKNNDSGIDPSALGLDYESLTNDAILDTDLQEFIRFYIERLNVELKGAGDDQRKRSKLIDDFTPRIYPTLVALNGLVHKNFELEVKYRILGKGEYVSVLIFDSQINSFSKIPDMRKCEITEEIVPEDCLIRCEISKKYGLKHLMHKSEISNKWSLPEYIVTCSLTGKRVIESETEVSSVTGNRAISSEFKTSIFSGKRAEPEFFDICEFSYDQLLKTELALSQVSGKKYRKDQEAISFVSKKKGHKKEFVISSVSKETLLKDESIKSNDGLYCAPVEAKMCLWSGIKTHFDDIQTCLITGNEVSKPFIGKEKCFQLMLDHLNGLKKTNDMTTMWSLIEKTTDILVKGHSKVESAELSPGQNLLAVCLEVRSWLGFKKRYAGLLYSIEEKSIKGKIAIGKRTNNIWVYEQ